MCNLFDMKCYEKTMQQNDSELNAEQNYMLKKINGTGLVALSFENVALVEAMIQNDSAYLKSSDEKEKPVVKKNMEYGGSTAWWMTQLKLFAEGKKTQNTYENIIYGAVVAVDRENSTHLNADKVGRNEMVDRIKQISMTDLIRYLKDRDFRVVEMLAAPTRPDDSKYKPRMNLSFASKFCHYACFYLFQGENEQDNFSIYDYVLRKAVPFYVKHYGLNPEKGYLNDYKKYSDVIDDIRKISKSGISRNGFDHLLWYYFKGRLDKLKSL